jgi:hypothetical protein
MRELHGNTTMASRCDEVSSGTPEFLTLTNIPLCPHLTGGWEAWMWAVACFPIGLSQNPDPLEADHNTKRAL